MTVIETIRYIVLALGILLGASFWLRTPLLVRYRPWLKRLAWLSILWLVVGEPALRGWQQYQSWMASDVTRGLLTETPEYIYTYALGRFALWRIVGAIVAAALYFLAMRFVVRPSGGWKLNSDEALLIAFGVVLAGWPGLVLYILGMLLLYAGILAFSTARGGGQARFPVALPATLALMTIPFIQHLLVWLSNTLEINLLLYNVTNLSI